MTNKATKYGLMTIAAVLLVAMAFAGAASASLVHTNTDGDETYIFTIHNGGEWNEMAHWLNYEQTQARYNLSVALADDFETGETVTEVIGNASLNKWVQKLNFDGNGKTLNIGLGSSSGGPGQALFGVINASESVAKTVYIHDLIITGWFSGQYNKIGVAALIGQVRSSTGDTYTKSSPLIPPTDCQYVLENILILARTQNKAQAIGGVIGSIESSGCQVGMVNCTLKDTSIVGADASYRVGGLIGRVANPVQMILEDCTVINSTVSVPAGSNKCVGGIFGAISGGDGMISLKDCLVDNCEIKTGGYQCGGITSQISISYVCLDNCTVRGGNVSGKYNVGGLVGLVYDDKNAYLIVVNCTLSDVNVTGTTGSAAGIIDNSESIGICDFRGNTISNVTIKAADLSKAYLFNRLTSQNINYTVGGEIVPELHSIQMENNNLILDSRITDLSGTVVTEIGNIAFSKSSNVTALDIESSGVTTIAERAFSNTSISEIKLPGVASDGYLPWTILNETSTAVAILTPENFAYALVKKDSQEVILNTNGGVISTKFYVNKSEIPRNAPVAQKIGYNFSGWYGEQTLTNLVFNDTGVVNNSVFGWTDNGGKWIHEGSSTLYAQWIPYSSENSSLMDIGFAKVATFDEYANVVKIVAIQNVSSAVSAVNITYNPNIIAPTSDDSYNRRALTPVISITLTGDLGSDNATIVFNLSTGDLNSATPNSIYLAHMKNGAWEYLKPSYIKTDDVYTFTVTGVTSFSPFVPISMTAIPQQYTPSSSKQTGSTIILQEGQVAPTAYATAVPTVAPTVKPTEQPATPTVIATEKPTTQPTQQSPAPFLGILAGLGAAAVLLRMRK